MATFDVPDLVRLADRSDGKDRLGELLRRLIWATLAKRSPSVHFLAGAVNNESGWDGHVQCPIAVDGVDEMHRSIWEVSARKDVEKKILEDYPEALKKTLPFDADKNCVVYVAATLRRVTAKKKASIIARLERDFGNPWAQIKIVDASDLVQWIERVPNVEEWLVGEFDIGRLRFGRALEHMWSEWRGKTVPQVTEQLISSGRPLTRIQEALRFAGSADFYLRCESIDEVFAVLYTAISAMPEQDRALLLSNALVVTNPEAAKALAKEPVPENGMPLTILAPPATTESQLLVAKGHRIVHVLARDDGRGSPITLERAVIHEFAAALRDSGVPDEEANVQARACGCSVSVWHTRQLFAAGQQPELPVWAQAEHANSVVLAIFLGGWCEESVADSEAIKAMCGLDAATFTDPLRKFRDSAHPLLQLIGHDWFVIAPVAAFEFIAQHVTSQHLNQLVAVCKLVFSEVTPEVAAHWEGKPPKVRMRNRKKDRSEYLMNGLAETLLRLAVLGRPLEERGVFSADGSAQAFVNNLVKQIPLLLKKPRVMASFDKQMPYLIEAAPEAFLLALETIAQGDRDELALWFSDEEGVFGRAYHTGLLWGLESLAWSEQYLERVAILLARLAVADRGGKVSNRPINSLLGIFLAWHPGTSCSIARRTQVLEEVLRHTPDVGWVLLMALMPSAKSVAFDTNRPKWRSLESRARRDPDEQEILVAFQSYITLALSQASKSATRLAGLVSHYQEFALADRAKLIDKLDELADSRIDDDARLAIWNALHGLVSRHRGFADAPWALDQASLDRLEKVAARFQARDNVLRHKWLFDELTPETGHPADDYDGREALLQQLRTSALREILDLDGWPGVSRMVQQVNYPQVVGHLIVEQSESADEILEAIEQWRAIDSKHSKLAIAEASGSCATRFSDRWSTMLFAHTKRYNWSPAEIATAILNFPDSPATFDLVARLPESVRSQYWSRRYALLRLDPEDLDRLWIAAQAFIACKRAIDFMGHNLARLTKLTSDKVLKIFDACVAELANIEKPARINIITYHLQKLLSWLRKQSEVSRITIAEYEYALLPLFQGQGRQQEGMIIYEMLGEEPAFFVDILRDIYNPASGKPEQNNRSREEIRSRAVTADRVLDAWRTVPGVDGRTVDMEKLNHWVDTARQQLREADRAEVGDQAIGRMLFRFPNDPEDGAWPHVGLRQLLERLQSKSIENGIVIAAFAAQGVTVREMLSGGHVERDLQHKWEDMVSKLDPKWSRAREVCKAIAECWRKHAIEQDKDASRERMKFSR